MTPYPDETTMTPCERTAELVPWLLNGTLDAATAAELRTHIAGCTACQADLRRARAALAVAGAHPPVASLVALAWDEVPEDADAVAAHLRDCALCRDELELARADRRASEAVATVHPTGARPAPGWRWGTLAAALLAVVGFGGWAWTVTRHAAETGDAAEVATTDSVRVATLEDALRERDRAAESLREELSRVEERSGALESELAELRSPVLNANVVEVYPDVALRGGEESVNEIHVGPGDPAVTLLLAAAAGTRPGPHRVQIAGPSGEVLWRAEGLELQPTGDFALTVPAALLPLGRVTVRLERQEAGRRPEAVRYELTVRRPP